MSKTFSKSDVASHNKGDSLWIVVDDDVYDLTKFQDEHPGTLLIKYLPILISLHFPTIYPILTLGMSNAICNAHLNQIKLTS